MGDSKVNLVGQKIWLEYFDQNYKFETAFIPQYCKIEEQYADTSGADDWYLLAVDLPFEYEGVRYDHLLIRSRWAGVCLGDSPYTSVFIVLVPNVTLLTNPFEFDRSLYIAWGLAARKKENIMLSPTATNIKA